MRYRIADLALVIAFGAIAMGMVTALAPQRVSTAAVCFVGFLALPVLLFARPKAGTRRCPYCGLRALRTGRKGEPVVCGECGSRFERVGERTLLAVSCPSDDRPWVVKFLPKLRRLRVELRPEK